MYIGYYCKSVRASYLVLDVAPDLLSMIVREQLMDQVEDESNVVLVELRLQVPFLKRM